MSGRGLAGPGPMGRTKAVDRARPENLGKNAEGKNSPPTDFQDMSEASTLFSPPGPTPTCRISCPKLEGRGLLRNGRRSVRPAARPCPSFGRGTGGEISGGPAGNIPRKKPRPGPNLPENPSTRKEFSKGRQVGKKRGGWVPTFHWGGADRRRNGAGPHPSRRESCPKRARCAPGTAGFGPKVGKNSMVAQEGAGIKSRAHRGSRARSGIAPKIETGGSSGGNTSSRAPRHEGAQAIIIAPAVAFPQGGGPKVRRGTRPRRH